MADILRILSVGCMCRYMWLATAELPSSRRAVVCSEDRRALAAECVGTVRLQHLRHGLAADAMRMPQDPESIRGEGVLQRADLNETA